MAMTMDGLEGSGVGHWMREALWAYPAVETVHIIGLALLFGSIVIVDLRLIGLGRNVSAVARFPRLKPNRSRNRAASLRRNDDLKGSLQ